MWIGHSFGGGFIAVAVPGCIISLLFLWFAYAVFGVWPFLLAIGYVVFLATVSFLKKVHREEKAKASIR